MAEAFGIFSGVWGVMQLVGNASYDYFQAVKEAPETVERLTQELKTISRLLGQVFDLLNKGVILGEEIIAAGLDCEKNLRSMLTEMEKHTNNKKSGRSSLRSFARRLKWPMKEKKIMEWLVQLERFKSTLDLELQKHSLMKLGEVQLEVQQIRTEQQSERLDERRAKLIAWLSVISYNLKHDETSNFRQKNTGNWILELDEYKEWEASDSGCLWVHGPAGSGKSVLMSNIINHLQGHRNGYTLSYCYCDFKDKVAATVPHNILRTLLVQLIADLPSTALDNFQDLFDMLNKGQAPPSNIRTLQSLLIRACACSSTGKATIIIDALDELERSIHRDDLLECLVGLAAEKRMRILVSSRFEQYIVDTFEEARFSEISLLEHSSDILADMRLHLSEELKTTRWRHVRGNYIQQEITQCLLEGSEENTFFWLKCQLDVLSKTKTNKELRAALKDLPQDLFRSYDRILLGIEKESQNLALRVLAWLVTSTRPMKLIELVEALAITEGESTLDFDSTVHEHLELVRICGSLVQYNQSTNTIYLSHATVKEFLLSQYLKEHTSLSRYAIELETTNAEVAKLSLTYLLLDDFTTGPSKTEAEFHGKMGSHPFYDYCAEAHYVFINAVEDDGVFQLLMRFLFEAQPQYASYDQVNVYNVNFGGDWQRLVKGWDMTKFNPPMAYVITKDMVWVARRILHRFPELLEAELEGEGTPLCKAIYTDSIEMVKMLLERGADVNKRSEQWGGKTPLFTSVTCGQGSLEIFQLLLEHGAEVNVIDNFGEHLLHGAAGALPVHLEFLINNCGMDPNLRCTTGATPLHNAVASSGSLSSIQTLIKAGADMFLKNNMGKTPIHIALDLRSGEILNYLMHCSEDFSPLAGCRLLNIDELDWAREEEWYPKLSLALSKKTGDDIELSNEDILLLQNALVRKIKLPENVCGRIFNYAGLWLKTTEARHEAICVAEKSPRMPYISVSVTKPVRRIVCRMRSHDQGWSDDTTWHGTYRGSNTWFEYSISFRGESSPARLVQRNVHSSGEFRDHQVIWDINDPTPEVRELFEGLQIGAVFEIYPMAKYPGWVNWVESMELDVYVAHDY